MAVLQKISPCLWFDDRAEEAARFYVSVFPNSAIVNVTRYGREGVELHGRPEGSVMTVTFVLDGQEFTGLNGGPHFTFSEAISFVVRCATQDEIDHYWQKLGEAGEPKAQQCGWLKDRFGLSWQIVPGALFDMIQDSSARRSEAVFKAMLQMKKLDLAALREAYEAA